MYSECLCCGATLDPGERCDCGGVETERVKCRRSTGTIPMTRKSFTPKIGDELELHGGNGQRYVVLLAGIPGYEPGEAKLQSVASYWTFIAHGIGRYDDGSIDWDYSTGGYFTKEAFA